MFFTVVKAAGILGIFFYHAYERYLGGQQEILKVFKTGLLRFFFSNTNTLVEYACAVTQTFLVMGNIGAELFVIASGFGLYYRYLSGREGWAPFFRRRFWRIIPLYYCSLVTGFLFNVHLAGNPFFSSPQGVKVLVQHVLLVQTFTQAYRYYSFLYFIAFIVHLYLLFPALVKAMESRGSGILVFSLSFFLSPGIRLGANIAGLEFQGILFTDFLPYFLFGMFIAAAFFYRRPERVFILDGRLPLLSFAAFIALICLANDHYGKYLRAAIIFSAFLSLPMLLGLIGRLKQQAAAGSIAYSAYAMYLFHVYLLHVGIVVSYRNGFLGHYLNWIPVVAVILCITLPAAYLIQKSHDMVIARLVSSRALGNS